MNNIKELVYKLYNNHKVKDLNMNIKKIKN